MIAETPKTTGRTAGQKGWNTQRWCSGSGARRVTRSKGETCWCKGGGSSGRAADATTNGSERTAKGERHERQPPCRALRLHERAELPGWWSEFWTVLAEGPRLVALEALSIDSAELTEVTAENKGQAAWLADFDTERCWDGSTPAGGPSSAWSPILVADDPAELLTVARVLALRTDWA